MGIRLIEVKEKRPSLCKMNIVSIAGFLGSMLGSLSYTLISTPAPPTFSFCVYFGHGPRRAVIYGSWKCVVTNFMQKNLLQNPAKM